MAQKRPSASYARPCRGGGGTPEPPTGQARAAAAVGGLRAWVSACEQVLGIKPWEAMAACRANSAEARDLALEASPLYQPLAELAREGFTGTVAKLHIRLDSMVSDAMRRSVRWPKAPNGLGMRSRAWPPISKLRGGVSVQPHVQGRRVVSVVSTAQIRKRPSVAVSSR